MMLSILRALMMGLSVFLLSQCTKIAPETHLQVNKTLASPYTLPATAYLALAKNQTGVEQQSLLIMAAGRLIDDGAWSQAAAILAQMDAVTDAIAGQKNILLARVDMTREQPRAARAHLAMVHDVGLLSLYYQVQFHDLLASVYQSLGHINESLNERIKLENLLPDDASKANNRRVLWLSLTTLPMAELHTLQSEFSENEDLSGWTQLALIARNTQLSPEEMLSNLQHWQAQFPHHPANYLLPQPLASMTDHLYPSPKHIALLLPVSGPLSGPGRAIQDGFMAAFDASSRRAFTDVRVYDTNTEKAVIRYQQAIEQGADYVVGPLSKADVSAVAAINHPVPTILLNDVDGHVDGHAYQFGLSKANEARQVAAKARKNGLLRALIIAPASVWGDEVVNAFSSQWRATGGTVVDTLHYTAQDDVNTRIRQFLQVSDSEAREKHLKQILGAHIESTPTRRQDFDVIFLVAFPSKARQIMPMLKYYYAGDMPVYATSSVYAGHANPMQDRDLDGVIFCDMPWVFTHQMGQRNWPEQYNSYNRLYALGLDAFALSNQLNQLILFPALGVSDQSGVLYLSSNQHIARILAFAQFHQGRAMPIIDSH